MDTPRLRRAAALVVVLSLLVAVAPATAALERPSSGSGIGRSLLDAFTAWLADLWPGSGPGSEPTPAGAASSAGSGAGPRLDSGSTGCEDPTVQPQLGGDIDPDG